VWVASHSYWKAWGRNNEHWEEWAINCLGENKGNSYGGYIQFLHILSFSWTTSKDRERRAPELEKEGWANLDGCWSVLERIRDGNWRARLSGLDSELLSELHYINMCLFFILLVVLPSSEFPWVLNKEIPSYLSQRDPNKWMGHPMDWEQWRGAFLVLGRSRGRELEKIRDNWMRIPVSCAILRCEWIVRGTLLLWIPSPNSGVRCYWNLEHEVYGWVERHSQVASCKSVLKDKCLSTWVISWV
jgi:hypothetical protein